jgi:hypothetical protein
MARGKAIVPRDGGNNDVITLELPGYAVRYLMQMCTRERTLLSNLQAAGAYNVAIDAAADALHQIERAIS